MTGALWLAALAAACGLAATGALRLAPAAIVVAAALKFLYWRHIDRRPGAATAVAAVLATLGVGIERWLFFAEAKHMVTLYYGATRA
ncbi:MAG TPA: hypothetical protein VMU87_03810 [Stellaceae bacterium]|nr:hypothetical protein [Stellaceae bacterium]